MFPYLTAGALAYEPPWNREPLEMRLAAIDGDRPCVVWLYEKPDTSTFRYRVYNMVESLRATADAPVAATWFALDEVAALLPRLAEVDTLVLARVRYDADVARLIARARGLGVRVLFDCDDLVFDTRYVHLVLDTLDQDTRPAAAWDWWFAYVGRIEATARLCDGAVTTNPFLAARLAERVAGPVAIVPNFLNRLQQQASEMLLAAKRARGFVGEGPVTIGYFSGTPSHNRDFAIATPALARLLARDPDVRVQVVGFMDHTGPLAAHADRVSRAPLHDWINLQRLIAEVEINIAPLQENVFTHCKSELKFFEAAIVGTWTVASPTSTFQAAIRGPHMGRLTRAEDWDAALDEAVMLVRCPARHAPLAEANAGSVRAAYGWDRFAARILAATTGPATSAVVGAQEAA
jgi:glycosyltransferase involved in cell wall biosynthesis